MTRYDTSTIHRYLDGVFADVPLTPDVQDLKEEIRGNLSARVAELEATGMEAGAASRKAIKELGDVREIIAQLGVEKDATSSPRGSTLAAYERNKVRPRPGFVVRTVVLSLAAAFGAVVVVLAIVGVWDTGWLSEAGPAACTLALPIGLLVWDALRQETTSSHPLPGWRAAGYGLATVLCVGGLALASQFITQSSHDWLLMTGVPLVVVAIVLYSYLGATQTNHKKAWVREETAEWAYHPAPPRFENDPAAAARFGLYSGVLWISAVVAFVVLSITIGFAWSWVAFLGALLTQLVLVARMAFPADGSTKDAP
ncbi:MAG: hypothetical protein JW722_03480 [Demequinaceae bacterium]|nr:hypothetical protein [Demequinaceae bacterium]